MSGSLAQTVSAQSAFWAVIALALNSFTQPVGTICHISDSPALRLSPILSSINAASALVEVACLVLWWGLPIRKAARLVLRARHPILGLASPRVSGNAIRERADIGHSPDRTWWFRLLVFVFGALPQAIKLSGLRGITVVHYLGGTYFLSFLIIEGLDLVAEKPVYTAEAEWPEVAVGLHGNIMTTTAALGLVAIWLHPPCFGWLINRYDWKACMNAASSLICKLSNYKLVLYITAILIHLYLSSIYSRLMSARHKQSEVALDNAVLVFMVFMKQHIAVLCLSCLLVYCFGIYDPAGTVKPSWTGYLG